ncbi:SDR family NAD(P)-dependent oxidoreductase [Arthrobacter zhaoguopingii]|uniref:SDR family NAD(P)-dependent oxidoreductase n=1 Tax=Arthrobacter zhaoguopingii TaxID=2681491 RepID=UPI00135AB42A|nr:SDR family oxidoreductase [Arthrobacter zhaoguopingii]
MINEHRTNISGLTVIVTGAGSGIGRATTQALGSAGANVLAVGRRLEALTDTAEGYPTVVPFAADIRGGTAAPEIVHAAVERWGGLDALINNAGVFAAMPLAEVTSERIDDLFITNVAAPSLLARAALPHLVQAQGTIVNVSSTFGHVPAPGAGHYGATKAAIEQLTRSWALELAPHRVRVNAVAPGPTESDALASAGLSDELISQVKDEEAARVPLGRRGNAVEVAEWILRFVDPSASWVTGQVMAVDGGLALT